MARNESVKAPAVSQASERTPEGGTVVVACKLPHGLKARIFRMEDVEEPVMGGGVKVKKRAVQVGGIVEIKGNAHEQGKAPKTELAGGYALTFGIDAQFWAQFMEQNKDAPWAQNGLVFAMKSADDVRAKAKEQRGVLSGLERLNTARTMKNGRSVPVDPRIPAQIEKANVEDDAA
jgi:hypothetical protein